MANWPEIVYGKQGQASVALRQPDALPEIPPMFKRDKEAEATAKKADVYVRYMGAKR